MCLIIEIECIVKAASLIVFQYRIQVLEKYL